MTQASKNKHNQAYTMYGNPTQKITYVLMADLHERLFTISSKPDLCEGSACKARKTTWGGRPSSAVLKIVSAIFAKPKISLAMLCP